MAETVAKAAALTVLDATIPVLILMEAVLRAVIQDTKEIHVTKVSIQKKLVVFITYIL